ncbi:hypothetical protein ABZ615_01465 [Streptomyces sp. NPDC007325]|uniref:hypothetical protein n=1 Tax=Streptomyces sp. NPDC007325 TaxID=3154588 RepID=UPI0033D865A0
MDITTGTVDILATVVAVPAPAEHVLDGLVGTPRGTAVRTRPVLNVHAQSLLAGAGAPPPNRELPSPFGTARAYPRGRGHPPQL